MPSISQHVMNNPQAARLAQGPKRAVNPKTVRNMVAVANAAAAAGKGALAAAVTIVAAGNVSADAMNKARKLVQRAENGDSSASAMINKINRARRAGNRKAARMMDLLVLAGKVNQESHEGLTRAQGHAAEGEAVRQQLMHYDYREDPEIMRHIVDKIEGMVSGANHMFDQGENQIRNRPRPMTDFQQGVNQIRGKRGRLRFTAYRGRTAIVG